MRRTRLMGGLVFTGETAQLVQRDVIIADGIIEDLVDPSVRADGLQVVDVTGQVVAPGFIDAHSHSELAYTAGVQTLAKTAQGVTTEVCGMDGLSIAPIKSGTSETDLAEVLRPLLHGAVPPLARTIPALWALFGAAKPPTRIAYAVPHAALRISAGVPADQPADDAQLQHMCAALAAGLDSGSIGFSTGLIYRPNVAADVKELLALANVCARFDVPFIVHLRNEGTGILAAVDEMLQIVTSAGCPLHLSHLKFLSKANLEIFFRALSEVERVREHGIIRISADQYPYGSSMTYLRSLLPRAYLRGTSAELLNLLRAAQQRRDLPRLFAAVPGSDSAWGWDADEDNRAITLGWDAMAFSGLKGEFREFDGKAIGEAAIVAGCHPAELLCDVLLAERGNGMAICDGVHPDVVSAILTLPWVSVGTDGLHVETPHPRLFGSFPRVLGTFVRERKLLTLPDALMKMTRLPAEQYGLDTQVGLIARGRAADIVVFDANEVSEGDAARCYAPHGISHVFLSGRSSSADAAVSGGALVA